MTKDERKERLVFLSFDSGNKLTLIVSLLSSILTPKVSGIVPDVSNCPASFGIFLQLRVVILKSAKTFETLIKLLLIDIS